jgi:hypothetical protein
MAASPAFAVASTEDLTETSEIPLRLEERLERVSLAELGDQPAGDDDAVDELAADDTLAGEMVVVTEQTVVFVTEPAPVADEVVVVPEPAEAPAETAPGDAMLRDLREAIDGNRIDLYLQPIVTLP